MHDGIPVLVNVRYHKGETRLMTSSCQRAHRVGCVWFTPVSTGRLHRITSAMTDSVLRHAATLARRQSQ